MEIIAVIFGGRTTEHDVSIVTAISSIIKPLELTGKYNVEAIYIDKDGTWYCDAQLKDISLYSSGKIKDVLAKLKPIDLEIQDGLKLVRYSGGLSNRRKVKKIDVVFPSMHGTYGEDGSLMGLLEMANVAYVGCDLRSSAITMDKVLAKQVASSSNVPVSKFISFTETDLQDFANCLSKTEKELTYPLFVKPAHLGSSIGISRVKNLSELGNAIEVAIHYDDKIIVEEAVNNLIEVTLPVMGNDNPKPALLERPLTTAEDFFDFDTKYIRGNKNGQKGGKGSKGAQGYSELPAKLNKDLYDKAQATGIKTYQALGCTGTCRIDMLIDSKTEKVYFNEANPLPGSLYVHNWNKAGISNVELVEMLIDLAKERYESRKKLATTFSTNFLKQF
jgi:D-alanine-D-alanine ligase